MATQCPAGEHLFFSTFGGFGQRQRLFFARAEHKSSINSQLGSWPSSWLCSCNPSPARRWTRAKKSVAFPETLSRPLSWAHLPRLQGTVSNSSGNTRQRSNHSFASVLRLVTIVSCGRAGKRTTSFWAALGFHTHDSSNSCGFYPLNWNLWVATPPLHVSDRLHTCAECHHQNGRGCFERLRQDHHHTEDAQTSSVCFLANCVGEVSVGNELSLQEAEVRMMNKNADGRVRDDGVVPRVQELGGRGVHNRGLQQKPVGLEPPLRTVSVGGAGIVKIATETWHRGHPGGCREPQLWVAGAFRGGWRACQKNRTQFAGLWPTAPVEPKDSWVTVLGIHGGRDVTWLREMNRWTTVLDHTKGLTTHKMCSMWLLFVCGGMKHHFQVMGFVILFSREMSHLTDCCVSCFPFTLS